MKILFSRAFLLLLMIIGYGIGLADQVWADPTDSGSIVVTGTVLPQPTSITTSLTAVPSAGTIPQQTTITFTLAYASANVGTVPLTLVAEWDKGTVTGATEANVDTLSYVMGSASAGYGSAPAIIDLQARKITWTISALPSGVGTQEVTFQLQTTASYTGPLEVTVPVVAKVLSPSGVADKSVTVRYAYQAVAEVTASPSVAPASQSSPTASTTVIASPQPTSVPTSSAFKSISIAAIGKSSARLQIRTNTSRPLVIRYGLTPQLIDQLLVTSPSQADHSVYLSQLQPATQYFLTVADADDEAQVSDIYSFKTASTDNPSLERKAQTISVLQNRSLIYSGNVVLNQLDQTRPISIVANSVIDLNLGLQGSDDITSVEVEVRSADVLGASTKPVSINDLQSQSTKMTNILPGVYVGKLKAPVRVGRYQLISRVEDRYGNLTEDQIGDVRVGAPMRIVHAKTGRPVEFAMAKLSVFNQQTQLYEVVSNVLTAIDNPAYSNANGEIEVYLHPAHYRAEVSALGFASTTVEFEIGNQNSQQFPVVELYPSHLQFLTPFAATVRTLHDYAIQLQGQLVNMSKSSNVLETMLVSQIACILFLALCSGIFKLRQVLRWLTEQNLENNPRTYFIFFAHQWLSFVMNGYLLGLVIFTALCLINQANKQSWLAALLTVVVTALWYKFEWQLTKILKSCTRNHSDN